MYVCLFGASFETFGSGSFGGPLGGPVGFGGPLVVLWGSGRSPTDIDAMWPKATYGGRRPQLAK